MAAGNKTLGRFELVDILPAPRGVPQIEVTFDIDADGVVNVSAKDLGTGLSQAIQVTASSGLSDEAVVGLVSEAEEHADADRKRREFTDLKNQADGLVYSTKRTLEEFSESIGDADRAPLEEAIEKVLATFEAKEPTELRAAVDELSGLTYKMTETLYAALGGDDGEA